MPDLTATCTRCDEGTVPPPIALDPDASNLCIECFCELAVGVMETLPARLEDSVEDVGRAMGRLGDSMEGLAETEDDDDA